MCGHTRQGLKVMPCTLTYSHTSGRQWPPSRRSPLPWGFKDWLSVIAKYPKTPSTGHGQKSIKERKKIKENRHQLVPCNIVVMV